MFRKLLEWIEDFLGLNGPIETLSPIEVVSATQTAPKSSIIENMTNAMEFHGEKYSPPLTVNALVHGGTLKQRDFIRNAINVLRHLVISDIFQDKVLDHGEFSDTSDNPLQIYKKFISGKDLYDQFEDHEMDIDITLYNKWWSKTLGYTYPNTRRTWINMKHFDIYEYEMMASVIGNIVHEYMHNIGYGHSSAKSKKSVPYAYGYIARDLALEFLGSGRDIAKYEEIYNA